MSDNKPRAYKLQLDNIVEIVDIKSVMNYNKQHYISIGDLLIIFKDEYKLSHISSVHVTMPPKEPVATFIVTRIGYKSKFYKFFKYFLKEPILWMNIKYMGGIYEK